MKTDIHEKDINTIVAALSGFENNGTIVQQAVKVLLTDEDILAYGKQLATNIKKGIPDANARFRTADVPLAEAERELERDVDYAIGQLYGTPDEDGYVNSDPSTEQASELARLMTELESVQSQRKSLKLENKVELDKLALDNELLRMRISLRYEMRDVSCTWYVNWSTGRKALVRMDTKDVVQEKQLSPEERQLELLDFEIPEHVELDEVEG